MNHHLRRGLAAAVILAWGTAAHAASSPTVGFWVERPAPGDAQALTVSVIDERTREALPSARVAVTGAPGDWTVTAAHDGYAAITVIGIPGGRVRLAIAPLPAGRTSAIVRGKIGGWDPRARRDVVQAGVVFRNLSAVDLVHFDLSAFVSPLRDTIDVYGPRQIPSNLVLPPQTVALPIGEVRLSKELYRVPARPGDSFRLAGLQGTARVSDLLPIFTGGGSPTVEVLNKLRFERVGLTGDIDVEGDLEQDFDTALELDAQHSVQPDRAPFAADIVVAALTDLRGDAAILIPTDVKAAAKRSDPANVSRVTLSGPKFGMGRARDVLTVAVGAGEMSGIVTHPAPREVRPGPFLQPDPVPAPGALPPRVSLRVPAGGMAAMIVDGVAESEAGKVTYPLWSVFALKAGTVEVATAGMVEPSAAARLSLMRLELERGFDPAAVDGERVLRGLRRFTRSMAELSRP